MHLKQLFTHVTAVASVLLANIINAQVTKPSVSLDDMRSALASQSAMVIEMREPFEHATGVAKGTVLLPISSLGKHLSELPKPGSKPLLIICNTQNRSSKVVEQLQAAGFTNASYVQGGMSQWNARGLPTVKP
jgi:rhodanese-related sulfurtransferase